MQVLTTPQQTARHARNAQQLQMVQELAALEVAIAHYRQRSDHDEVARVCQKAWQTEARQLMRELPAAWQLIPVLWREFVSAQRTYIRQAVWS